MVGRCAKAEAAVWLARLHTDERTTADERAFRAWLAENEDHAAAFAELTAAWDVAGAYVPDQRTSLMRGR